MLSRKFKLRQQLNTTTLIRMAKIWNTENNKCWRGYGATETLVH